MISDYKEKIDKTLIQTQTELEYIDYYISFIKNK